MVHAGRAIQLQLQLVARLAARVTRQSPVRHVGTTWLLARLLACACSSVCAWSATARLVACACSNVCAWSATARVPCGLHLAACQAGCVCLQQRVRLVRHCPRSSSLHPSIGSGPGSRALHTHPGRQEHECQTSANSLHPLLPSLPPAPPPPHLECLHEVGCSVGQPPLHQQALCVCQRGVNAALAPGAEHTVSSRLAHLREWGKGA